MEKKTTTVPVSQWTNGGAEVLIVRFADKDGKSYKGFQHPTTVGERVTAPDWKADKECGGGIHGWPWAMSLGDGKEPQWDALWMVYGVDPADVVDLGGKVKFRTGVLRHVGTWQSATNFVLAGQMAWVYETARGAASATGGRGAASATGGRGAASATGGWGAASATGWSGAASATGWSGAASATGESGAASATGESGAASATGWSGAASATGDCSAAAVTGLNGKAKSGERGCIALAWLNPKTGFREMRCARTGKGQRLKADTWYTLDADGRFIEVRR